MALGGPEPAAVVDRIRELGWPSVLGNTDQVLGNDAAARERIRGGFMEAAAQRTRELLGEERVEWLIRQPLQWRDQELAVVHATPGDCWAVVAHDASDEQLRTTYGELGTGIVVYGHIHHPFIRELDALTVANSGSVSLALDGDVRAKYAVVEDGRVHHRQIVYDVEQVARAMLEMDYPSAEMYATWLRTGRRD
jgi:hypothetical protein